jgi:hypothetical protein
MSRARFPGLIVAMVAMAAALAFQYARQAETLSRYDRWVLPGFDARVYVAMAEAPAFFTRAPWGHRVLAPALVHLWPGPVEVGSFVAVGLGCLWVAGGALYLWLRRLGNADWACVLAVVAFGLSRPVSEAVACPMLAEPLSIALLALFLLALQADALAAAALVAVLGVLAKEVFLGFLPLVFFARLPRGARNAALSFSLVALPALGSYAILHTFWVPHLRTPGGWPGWDVGWTGVYRILAGAGNWWRPALLGGLTLLALLGALRAAARPFLARYGWLIVVTWSLPFAASVYTDDRASVPFFADDIPRLLMYALPPLLHLALLALDRVRPHRDPRLPADAGRPDAPWLGRVAIAATLLALLAPLAWLDRYRRVDLAGPRDGPLVLAVARQSLAFARRLAAGRPVEYQPRERRFVPGLSDARHLERMRWFLREGWGHAPHYGVGPIVMQSRVATVLVPCLRPDEWTLTLALRAPREEPLRIELNGREIGQATVLPEDARFKLRVPPEALFRGDNRLDLAASSDQARVELLDLRIQPTSLPK